MEERNNKEEISLKEIVDLIREYVTYLWTKKWYILIAGIIGGAIFFTREYIKPTTYTAELTFMVNEDDGGSLGGAAALLGQFGLGGGSSSEYNLEKIKELSRSRKITQNVLFDSIVIGDKNDLIANHIIRLYDYHKDWEDLPSLKDFFFSNFDSQSFSNVENSALKALLRSLVGTSKSPGILRLNYEESTGILNISAVSLSPDLSIALSESMYTHLSYFYVKQSTEKQQFTLDLLEEKSDSTEQALYKAEYTLAKLMDNSQGFRLRTTQLKEQQLNRDIQIMTLAYGEILKNKATAEFLLESARPFFQVIDRPIYPLTSSTKILLINFVIGFCIGIILISGLLLGVNILTK